MSISVLYIQHSGTFGGASRSLLEMIRAFPSGSVKPHLITQKGNVAIIFKEEGIPVIDTLGISQFDNTRYGYYRGLRWLILIREIWYIYYTIKTLIIAKRDWKNIDIIHINEITNIVAITFAKIIFKKPLIVHVRSVQQDHKAPLRYLFVKSIIERCADCIIAIDKTVRNSLPQDLSVRIIHNGFTNDKDENYIHEKKESEDLSKLFKTRDGYLKIAMVGNLLIYKGVFEFVKAAKICIDEGYKIIFYLIGGNPHSRLSFKKTILKKLKLFHYIDLEIRSFIQKHDLYKNLYIIDFTEDIHTVYENIDILCFPSYLNAVGRPVIEASFYKVPSIVAITDPLDDTMIDDETGICIQKKNPQDLAGAIEYFYSNQQEIDRMGQAAFQLALENFDAKKNAEKMLKIYQNCLPEI